MSGKSKRVRFSLSHLLVLFTGIVVGMASLRPWELGVSPASLVMVELQVVEVDEDRIDQLGPGGHSQQILAPESAASIKDQIRKLQEAGNAERISAPKLMTRNGQTATIQIGNEVQVQSIGHDGTTIQTPVQIGLKVNVLPTILRTGRIQLAVSPEFREFTGEKQNNMPTIHTRAMQTEVEFNDGETMITGLGDPRDGRQTVLIATAKRVEPK